MAICRIINATIFDILDLVKTTRIFIHRYEMLQDILYTMTIVSIITVKFPLRCLERWRPTERFVELLFFPMCHSVIWLSANIIDTDYFTNWHERFINWINEHSRFKSRSWTMAGNLISWFLLLIIWYIFCGYVNLETCEYLE